MQVSSCSLYLETFFEVARKCCCSKMLKDVFGTSFHIPKHGKPVLLHSCLCFLSHPQQSGRTVLVGIAVVASSDPKEASDDGRSFAGLYNWHSSTTDTQYCGSDMKAFSHLFNVRITHDVELKGIFTPLQCKNHPWCRAGRHFHTSSI